MTIYEDLRRDFEQFHRKQGEESRAAQAFVERFAEAFRIYIGAPYAYELKDGGDRRGPQRYVEPVPFRNSDGRPEQPRHPNDRARRQPDGEWLSGLKVILEPGPNAGPKLPWLGPVRFVMRGNQVRLAIGKEGRAFTVSSDDPSSFQASHEFLAELIRTAVTGGQLSETDSGPSVS